MTQTRRTASQSTRTLVLAAILTALVVVLQLLATFTAFFGPFASAVALIPIGVGAILCGPIVGAWLGFVFGAVVLLSGGAALFLPLNFVGTIIIVLAKGTLCGLASGFCHRIVRKFNEGAGVVAAALTCPIVNTGVFLAGCALFLLKDAAALAATLGIERAGMGVFWALATGNFLLEIAFSALLIPVLSKILTLAKK